MNPIQIIASDLFDKIRSRFYNLEMGDETGAVTIDPAEARFFDFDFIHEGTKFGRVSISINEQGSLKVYFRRGITEDSDTESKKVWYRFLKEMRQFAMRRLLRFDTRDVAKANLDKNDFKYLANKQMPKEEETMQMNESRFNGRNTKKTSRKVTGRTEVIVRHNSPVDEMVAGSRSRKKNIRAIFIQNKDGERFKYPFIHIAGALAMARHVEEGGAPHDDLGKQIIEVSEEIAQLQEFGRHVHRSQLHDDAMGITERALGKLNELKTHIEALSGRKYYHNWANNTREKEVLGDDLLELDAVTMEEYKSKFTEKNFKEELTKFFPLIHRIMQEENRIELDEYIENMDTSTTENADQEEKSRDEFDEFNDWADSTENGELDDEQIEHLRSAIENQKASGESLDLEADSDAAIRFFRDAGINRENLPTTMVKDFEHKMQVAAEEFPDTDPMEVFAEWAKQEYPSLLTRLGMNQPEGAAPAPEAPAPEAPPAPEMAQQPQTEDAPIATVHGMMPAVENDDMGGTPTMMSKESHHKNNKEQPSVGEIAEIVNQFYNAVNKTSAPFRSETQVCLEVEKKCTEKYGEQCREYSRHVAERMIKNLKHKWEKRHRKSADSFNPLDEEPEQPEKAVDYTIPAAQRKAQGQNFPVKMGQVQAHDERHRAEFEKRKAAVDAGELGESISEFERIKKLAGLTK